MAEAVEPDRRVDRSSDVTALDQLEALGRAISRRDRAGAGANVAISGVAATTSAAAHLRAGRIDWRLFAWMMMKRVPVPLITALA